MALTTVGADLTTAHRAAQLAVRARNLQGLVSLWRAVDPTRLADTIDVFVQAAVLLAGQGSDESAATAARYFELFRTAEGVGGSATAAVAGRLPAVTMANDIRGAALKGIIDGRKAGMTVEAASHNGLIRVIGTMSKLVLGGGRRTIIGGIDADRRALGWTRVTSGSPCAFCAMLSSRGPAYKTEKSADFQPHDHCACTPEPIYRGDPVSLGSVAQAADHRDDYKTAQEWARASGTMSGDTSNNALNNYRRWLANGKPDPGSATPDGGNAGTDGGNPV
jgi:hypothetical protein